MSIAVADNFSYQGAKPLDARFQFNTIAAMRNTSEATLYNGCLSYVNSEKKYYVFDAQNEEDLTLGRWREYSGGGSNYTAGDGINIENDEISTDNMQSGDIADVTYPLPSPGPGVTSLGGLTDVALTDPQNGNALVYDSEHQKWVNGEGGKTYTSGDGINIDANYEISTDNMQSGDMDDVVPTLPGIASRYHKYSTTEQIVGEWINGEKIYEKTIECGSLPNASQKTVSHNISNLGRIISISAVGKNPTSGGQIPIPFTQLASSGEISDCVFFTNTDVVLISKTDRSGVSEVYVTLLYTKATN